MKRYRTEPAAWFVMWGMILPILLVKIMDFDVIGYILAVFVADYILTKLTLEGFEIFYDAIGWKGHD